MADVETFLKVFPEFTGTDRGQLTFWLEQAQSELAQRRLGKRADLANYLFVAHNLVLNAQDLEDKQAGSLPGDTLGPVSSESAGGLSVTYDTGSISSESAGVYNATSYGQRLWKMLISSSLGGVYAPGLVHGHRLYGYRGGGPWR